MTTRTLLTLIIVLSVAGTARAQEPREAQAAAAPARCFADSERWTYDRNRETLAAPGERFLEDMRACDPTFAAAVIEAIRYEIHADESAKFVRARGYVLAAYGVAWALLAASALFVWHRQRKLAAELTALEARIAEAERT
jgi:hypothetical protein